MDLGNLRDFAQKMAYVQTFVSSTLAHTSITFIG